VNTQQEWLNLKACGCSNFSEAKTSIIIPEMAQDTSVIFVYKVHKDLYHFTAIVISLSSNESKHDLKDAGTRISGMTSYLSII